MTGCSLSWLPTADQVEAAAAILGSVVMLASGLCALCPKPPPGSRWAKLRAALEAAALMVGHARAAGLVAPTPAIDNFTRRAAEFARSLRAPAAVALLLIVLCGSTAMAPSPMAPYGDTVAPLGPNGAAGAAAPLPAPAPTSVQARLLQATSSFIFDQGPGGRLVIRALTPAR
jgi:hypothetical protein